MTTIDTVLNEISDLSLDDKELVENILHKRIIDEKRNEIYNDFQENLKEYSAGRCKSGTIKDLMKDVEEAE